MEIDNNIVVSENGTSFENGVHEFPEAVAGKLDGIPNGSSSSSIAEVVHESTTTIESNPSASSEVKEFIAGLLTSIGSFWHQDNVILF